ncbi:MAG: hypothetical protein KU37_05955 [Sulfuricurvum sp. PC08-66]|nr:MAG: hypothetical protein KU37_05955 [Sulfuricurvum sp. PC08-66]
MFRWLVVWAVTMLGVWGVQKEYLLIHAPLLPKMAMMQYGFEKSVQNATICVAVLYDTVDESMAHFMVDAIQASAKGNYRVCARMVTYDALKEGDVNAELFYLMPTTAKAMRDAIAHLATQRRMSFAYDWHDLAYGATMSVRTLAHVKPIVNLEAAQANRIALRALLLKISDIYGQHE